MRTALCAPLLVGAVSLAFTAMSCGGGTKTAEPNATMRAALAAPRGPIQSAQFRIDAIADIALPDGSHGGYNVHIDGTFVAPDSRMMQVTFTSQEETVSTDLIIVGGRVWRRVQPDDWFETSASDPLVKVLSDLVPPDALQIRPVEIANLVFSVPGEAEVVEGVTAHRYHLSSDENPSEFKAAMKNTDVEKFLGGGQFADSGGLDLTVWLADDLESLVKIRAKARFLPERLGQALPENVPPGTLVNYDATVTITRYNDPTIAIAPPP